MLEWGVGLWYSSIVLYVSCEATTPSQGGLVVGSEPWAMVVEYQARRKKSPFTIEEANIIRAFFERIRMFYTILVANPCMKLSTRENDTIWSIPTPFNIWPDNKVESTFDFLLFVVVLRNFKVTC